MALAEAGVAEKLKQAAAVAALSLAMAVSPFPAAANNVRVEDVDNPSMQAGWANLNATYFQILLTFSRT